MDTKESSFNRDFIYTVPSTVLFDSELTVIDLRIYMIIQSFMHTCGEAWPSNNWLAKKCGIERRSAIRSLERLVSKGYVKKITQNDKRYLIINYTKCPVEVVTVESPPSDISVTPPSDSNVTLYSSNIITTKKIKTLAPPPEAPKKYEYPETLYPISPLKEKTLQKSISKSQSLSLKEIICALPFCIDLQVVEDWLKVRKTKRAPVTSTALKLLINELEMFKTAGIDPVRKFEEMVANGWSSIKFAWGNQGNTHLASSTPYFENKSTDWIKDLGKTPFDEELNHGL